LSYAVSVLVYDDAHDAELFAAHGRRAPTVWAELDGEKCQIMRATSSPKTYPDIDAATVRAATLTRLANGVAIYRAEEIG
jgi:hypothetical protein